MSSNKRPSSPENTENANKEEEEEGDAWIGPMPSEATTTKPKKRKGN